MYSIIISCVPKKYVKEGKVDYHTIIITDTVLVYIEIYYPIGSKKYWKITSENITHDKYTSLGKKLSHKNEN